MRTPGQKADSLVLSESSPQMKINKVKSACLDNRPTAALCALQSQFANKKFSPHG